MLYDNKNSISEQDNHHSRRKIDNLQTLYTLSSVVVVAWYVCTWDGISDSRIILVLKSVSYWLDYLLLLRAVGLFY